MIIYDPRGKIPTKMMCNKILRQYELYIVHTYWAKLHLWSLKFDITITAVPNLFYR